MKKIGIDLSFIDYFGHGEDVRVSSLVIFAEDIISSLSKLTNTDDYVLLCRFCDIDYIAKLFPKYNVVPLSPFESVFLYKITNGKKLGGKFFWKNSLYRKVIKKYNLGLIWFPFANYKNFIPTKIKIQKLLTVHDISTYREEKGKKFFDRVFSDSDNRFITISEYSKKDIFETTKIKGINISVISTPVKLNYLVREDKIDGMPQKYILDINSYTKRKNTITLLKAFLLIKDEINCDLVFCGGQKDEKYFEQLLSFVNENKLADRVKFYYSVSDSQKLFLLKHATLFVNPSLFEGFGKTPVEAAMMKVPVITSKETSLYEVTKGLLNYYNNTTDEHELAEIILNVLSGKVEKDLEQIAEIFEVSYSPDELTKKYLSIFEEYKN